MPEAPAVLTAKTSLSYVELDRAIAWTAGILKKAGVERGDIVAIRLRNRTQHLMTSLALARLGAAQIAFFADGSLPSEAGLVRRLGIAASVADKTTAAVLPREGDDKPSFVAFMRTSPLVGLELEFERDASPWRST
ncbi:MAG: AMP-binding protein [Alphaproteobacteria bacterium]|nr:AMP-binding protein [Alphaproteobacteria bacterium]